MNDAPNAPDVADVYALIDDGRVAVSSGGWLSLELEGTNLHVTIVSVSAPRAELLARARHAGARCEVALRTYHKASSGSMVVGFWEVSGITGFDAHYSPQAAIYHVTDKSSLEDAARPRHAGDALACLRGMPSEHVWTFASSEEEATLTGIVVLR